MAWFDEAVFYHIYPLGLLNAPAINEYGPVEHRLVELFPWIDHIKAAGFNAIYIGPFFESVGHGYETTDYKKLDSRLGDNDDLIKFVSLCHENGIKVIFDGVFNHTGRDFFAFQDIKKNRENSRYKDWYCNVSFYGNNEYNDGFSYDNWGGYNLLAKLNQWNPEVKDYICDVIRYWVEVFDVDGIRLDAADVMDFEYMKALRRTGDSLKADFYLMGEVIHGDYTRWANKDTLHAVTNYALHKALYSGHNDHNYFEIAHTVKRLYEMAGNRPDGLKLYNFVDNHDVERIYTKLSNKANYMPAHILLYTLPGIPSVYYGSEYGIEGRKEKGSDASLRPALKLNDMNEESTCLKLITALGKIRQATPEISYGHYFELLLTNRQYAFARELKTGEITSRVIVMVNNDENDASITVNAGNCKSFVGALSGQTIQVENGNISACIKANSGEIWIPSENDREGIEVSAVDIIDFEEVCADSGIDIKESREVDKTDNSKLKINETETSESDINEMETSESDINESETSEPELAKISIEELLNKNLEDMTVPELQEMVLYKLGKNGPITDQMRKDVSDNVYKDSLINWVKSFR